MDKSDTFLLILGGIVGGIFLFSGVISTVAKSFNAVPEAKPVISDYDAAQQRDRIEQIKENHRRHMEQQQTRIKDLQRR